MELIIAIALLTAPVGEVPAGYNTPIMRHMVASVAREFELLDHREGKYVFARPEDWAGDLNLLRRRYADLKDAPPASDSLRFPDREQINALICFNREYRQHVESHKEFHLCWVDQYREALRETDRLYEVWDKLRDSKCIYYYVTVRRAALLQLRDSIGEEAYYQGKMPPHVPVGRFQSIP